jgi:predicted TIM-barrel fold metal-dependent hydrolase
MIVDTHCHAWRRWPYDRSVPDPSTRGSVESLLHEMDANGVDHAAVVCARIGAGSGGDGFGNEDNNDYVLSAAQRHPDRLTAWIDVDCVWRPDHHAPGAAARLRAALEETGASGFTHYVTAENDGWLRTDDGREFFAVAEEAGVIASLAIGPAWWEDLAVIAAQRPRLAMLIHHLGTPAVGPERERELPALLALAAQPSVGVKVSGFPYNAERRWDYPYPEAIDLFTQLLSAFGAERLHWGSDFPASRDQLTYRQSLEVVREHCGFAGDAAIAAILGGSAARLMGLRTS